MIKEADGSVIYPGTIAQGVYDIANNQPLSDTLQQQGQAIAAMLYTDVYIGIGSAAQDVMVASNHHEAVYKGSLVSFSNVSGRLWLVIPPGYSPSITMGGLEVPMTQDGTITSGGVTYSCLKSDNLYNGSFSVRLG